MLFYLAPMEGITGYIVRNAYAHYFPYIDKYFTPSVVCVLLSAVQPLH